VYEVWQSLIQSIAAKTPETDLNQLCLKLFPVSTTEYRTDRLLSNNTYAVLITQFAAIRWQNTRE
jgi:hypothetical protein